MCCPALSTGWRQGCFRRRCWVSCKHVAVPLGLALTQPHSLVRTEGGSYCQGLTPSWGAKAAAASVSDKAQKCGLKLSSMEGKARKITLFMADVGLEDTSRNSVIRWI